jgi:hypothetical protein
LDAFRKFVAWLACHHAGRVVTVVEGARRIWARESVAIDNTTESGIARERVNDHA